MIKRSNLSTALLDKVVNIPVIQITFLVILFILVFQSYFRCRSVTEFPKNYGTVNFSFLMST